MDFLTAALPSAGVLLIFWLAIRALVQADRRERLAHARWEAEQEKPQNGSESIAPGPIAPNG